jgi:peptidoglycan-N-acetylglucosamine deacetylase
MTGARNAVMSRAALTHAGGTPAAQVWRRVDGAGRRVALTFDDGDVRAWRRILRVLEAHRARATFFVLGRYVSAAPSLARRTLADGDAVGSHGWSHAIMARESAGQIRGELQRSSAPWRAAAGATPMPYLRPPYGIYGRETLRVAAAQGFTRIVLWDVDPEDWRAPGPRVIVLRVLHAVRPGSIVLLHVKPQTAAALPAILRGLRTRGLRPVTVPELLMAAGYR